MDTLHDAHKDEEKDKGEEENPTPKTNPDENNAEISTSEANPDGNNGDIVQSDPKKSNSEPPQEEPPQNPTGSEPMAVDSTLRTPKTEPLGSEDVSLDSISEDEQNPEKTQAKEEKPDENQQETPSKKQKSSIEIENSVPKAPASGGSKKSSKKKSKGNNVWTKPTSRKGKKKAKNNSNGGSKGDETMFLSAIMRFPDRNDDSPDSKICLSKINKAEKVELSEDRMSAGSCKGYRMVRATRGVVEGAWYFEIKVVNLGETGHTRLGWATEKGDLQAPVGYDSNSYGYRDIDGSKIHKAMREKYGEEGYKEGDVVGFYINLPNGDSYAPKLPQVVWYKGQRYVCAPDQKEEPPKIVPGSQISFFKNGICQGVAFKDLCGGRYYPAASMYTLPTQPNCVVKFNFGPDFECFPMDFGDRPAPRPMIEVSYHGFDNGVENGSLNDNKQ